MITGLVYLLIYILIVALIGGLALWVLDQMGPAEPIRRFARIAIIVICCLIIILLLLNAVGGLDMPGPAFRR